MKHILIGLTFLTSLNAFSQNEKPEVVYSIAKEIKEISWYETQLRLWKAEIENNNQNGEAWINYYRAVRALKNLSDEGSVDKTKYKDLSAKILVDIQKAMPASFEYYFIADAESGYAGGSEYLKKAEALRPYDPRILESLIGYYHMNRNQPKFEEYGREMYKANSLPVGVLNWGYNLLSEVDQNAVIFTAGDNDTYASWIIQSAKNFRKDVTVVNVYLIRLDDYRNKLLAELGYAPLQLPEAKTEADVVRNDQLIRQHFFKGKRPVYVATSAMGYFYDNYSEKLFLTGLAYKYSESSFDNESVIRRNYEKRYLLDYLNESFAYNIADLKGLEFNGLYLPSMMKLYKQYDKSEDLTKKAELEVLLIKIAEQNGQQSEVMKIIEE